MQYVGENVEGRHCHLCGEAPVGEKRVAFRMGEPSDAGSLRSYDARCLLELCGTSKWNVLDPLPFLATWTEHPTLDMDERTHMSGISALQAAFPDRRVVAE